ncbi:MAG: GTP-binding protein [Opitutaceae bacterium]
MPESPTVYIVYGVSDSGKREIIFDLFEEGVPKTSNILFFQPEGEKESEFDSKINELKNVSTITWALDGVKVKHGQINAAADVVVFMAPGSSDPADIAEAIKSWMEHNSCELGRVITVVNCSFLQNKPGALPWYQACIHFSDVILLNRREKNDNKWVKDFTTDFKKQCSPARFVLVKRGRVANPAEVLEPEARRLSLYFDELVPIEEDGLEEEQQPDDLKPDKYIERLASGHRAIKIPSINKFS